MDSTIITNTLPLALIPLPSGSTGAIVYSASFGEIVIALLLAALIALQILQMWRTQRGTA
jgi:1,4-dihydroxy-2-naphthoate octaprenyltransferase